MAEPTAPPSTTATPPRRRRKGCFFLILLLLGAGLLFALYVWIALKYTYSEGDRVGYVQKFSRKGFLCKTGEGEIAMATIPGTMQQVFAFSVRDAAVIDRLNQIMGQRVRLHYEQHKGLPTSCFGETEYFVTDVQPVGPP